MNTIKNKQLMSKSVAKVITWMIVFLLLYLPLVFLVLVSAVGCILGVVVSISTMIEKEFSLGIIGLLFFAAIGFFLVYPFSMGILRPFFVLYKSGRDERIEITEIEAPELVHLIYKIADLTKNDRPKHIYVSAATNACVFFDTRFSNIFVPVKKNIEVGLGIFKHTSVAETASCIAHEFGHFSQDTMRWGTIVHVLNTIIVNMMSVNERWNTIVNKLINAPWIIGGGIIWSILAKVVGWILYGITIGYMSIMEAIYKKIQLAHLELSRKMEYEADAVSASIVGSEVYISFASKLLELTKRENAFMEMTQRMASRNLLVNDYWDAYSKTDKYLAELTNSRISSQTRLSEPLDQVEDSKLVFEAVYSSHPDWNSRINAIKVANYPKTIEFEGKAWDLIPQSVKDKVAKQTLDDLSKICDAENPVKTVSDEELSEIIEHDNYWYQYAPYFQRDIIEFDYKECTPNSSFELGDKQSISVINKYNSAKIDYDNAQALRSNKDVKKAIYQGVVYKTSKLPMEIIESKFEEQKQLVQQIDKRVCEYAMSRVSDIGFIKEAYRKVFYAQDFINRFETLVTKQQNATMNILNKSASNTNSHQYATIRDSLRELNICIKDYGIARMSKELFGQSAPEDAIECVNEYLNHCNTLFLGDSISGESINLVMYTCNWIRDVHENILSEAKMAIIDACLGRIKSSEKE